MTGIKKGVIFILTVSFCMSALGGCQEKSVDCKTPEAVAKSLIRSYQTQDIEKIKECYGLKDGEEVQEELQKEIDYNLRLFNAYHAKNVEFKKSDSLGKSGDSQLVWVRYDYEVEEKEKGLKCPALSFYFVDQEDKRYFVVPAKDVTEEMSIYSRTAFEKFSETSTYKKYQKDLKAFQKENASFKEKLEKRFSQTDEEA